MPTDTEAWVVYQRDGPFRRSKLTLDDPLEDEVLVEIVATGICHTDFTVAKGLLPGASYPVILGHEGAGKVLSVGGKVATVAPGDSVLLSFAYCNDCVACSKQSPHACVKWGYLNFGKFRSNGSQEVGTLEDGTRVHGAFFGQSSFGKHALAKATSANLASLAPMGCGMQTGSGAVMNVAKPSPDHSVLISGMGGVGMAALFAAKELGVQNIIAVDMNSSRLELAKKFGATHAVNPKEVDTVKEVMRLTNDLGADFAIECSGVVQAAKAAFMALAFQGVQVQVGDSGVGELSVPLGAFLQGLRTIIGCVEGNGDPRRLIPTLVQWSKEGKFPLAEISAKYRWDDFAQAEKDAHDGNIIKAILVV
ncbi:hypothetical protein OIO90_001449 [Microbotryomycetes sp. JL221]|nr:hypothetical protein OIO90_001449 [Microbotryomycetes sp. JL221]